MATTVGEARFLIELAKLMVDPQAVSDRLGKATLTKIWRALVKKTGAGRGRGPIAIALRSPTCPPSFASLLQIPLRRSSIKFHPVIKAFPSESAPMCV